MCCLAWHFASPAIAADDPAPTSPLVILERAEFVRILEQVDYLRQDQANLTEQIAALSAQIEAHRAKADSLQHAIRALDAELEDQRKKDAVLEADRERLSKALEQSDFWGAVKNYGLVFLGALAVAALAL